MIDALAARPRRWAALCGLALAGARVVASLLAGGTPSVAGAAAAGIAVGLVFWGVGILLQRQRDAAAEWPRTQSRTEGNR